MGGEGGFEVSKQLNEMDSMDRCGKKKMLFGHWNWKSGLMLIQCSGLHSTHRDCFEGV